MKKKLLTIFLAASLLATMSFAGTSSAFADATDSSIPEAREVQSGERISCDNTDSDLKYYKIKSPSNGYFTVQLINPVSPKDYEFTVILKNYQGKEVYRDYILADVGGSYYYYNKAYIGVPKGTYYIGIAVADDIYDLKITHTAVKETSGKSKQTAVSIYKGKYRSGILTATQSTASSDWYKIKLNKRQKVNIKVSTKSGDALGNAGGNGSGAIKVTVYRKGVSKSIAYFWFGREYADMFLKSFFFQSNAYSNNQPWPAGTYYFKVQRDNYGNGYYKIKWF